MSERQLVSVKKIDSISPIEGADRIEVATLGGWRIVVGRDEFSAGDVVLYFEIDSALPLDDPRFTFLESRGSKVIDEKKYHVLKTIKLRGVYSQGLVLPVEQFPEVVWAGDSRTALEEHLGVFKYEPPVPVSIGGEIAGPFFSGIQKTDAERIQNIDPIDYERMVKNYRWAATLKIDGTSMTGINDIDGFRVASRNWELRKSEENALWQVVQKYNLEEIVPSGWTVQGEVHGPGIQSNRLKAKDLSFKIFRVLDERGRDAAEWPKELEDLCVPFLDLELPDTIDQAIEQADGLKYDGLLVEGIVWHEAFGQIPYGLDRPCFKVINNRYLIKNGE